MCDVGDVGCCECGMWGCEMLGMWDVGDVGCWGCGMFGRWDVREVGCSGGGMFGMWDVGDVGCSVCGMWDVGCLPGCGMLIYKMPGNTILIKLSHKVLYPFKTPQILSNYIHLNNNNCLSRKY